MLLNDVKIMQVVKNLATQNAPKTCKNFTEKSKNPTTVGHPAV